MSEQFDSEKWLREFAEEDYISPYHEDKFNQCANELAAAKSRIAEYEKFLDKKMPEWNEKNRLLEAECELSRKLYEALKMGEWASDYDKRRSEAIAAYEKERK